MDLKWGNYIIVVPWIGRSALRLRCMSHPQGLLPFEGLLKAHFGIIAISPVPPLLESFVWCVFVRAPARVCMRRRVCDARVRAYVRACACACVALCAMFRKFSLSLSLSLSGCVYVYVYVCVCVCVCVCTMCGH